MNIYVVGTSGSGKSTLARKLAKHYGSNHIELDDYYFLPNWVKRPREEFIKNLKVETSKGPWVMCGNYSKVRAVFADDIDQIIWLDYPLYRCFFQAFKRTMTRMIKKETCCNGNYETFYRQFLTRDSIFYWILVSHWRNKRVYTALLQDKEQDKKMKVFKSPKETQGFLDGLLITD